MYDFFVIGNISIDENIYLGEKEKIAGGAILYSSAVYASLGHKVAVLTKLKPSDYQYIQKFNLPEEVVYFVPSKETTFIRNEYLDESREKRISTALATADPITFGDIPKNMKVRVIHLASLIFGEYQTDLIKLLSGKGKIAVDVQGFLRNIGEGGKLIYKKWEDKELYLPYIDYLKADAAEAKYLTGENNTQEAARALHKLGAKEILITHYSEVLAYDGTRFYSFPLKPKNLSGRTGRGDTCFSSYLSERLKKNIEDSLLFAVALTSIKLATPGPFKGTRQDVESFIKENY